ncbi:hypothetical protein EMCRGX_G009393 [Ephydatia muelleri]
MAEYSRKEFSQYSKAALLDHIEQQNEQLGRLETRFRDVVRAYKSLTKEKEALDACLKVLSKPTPPVPSSLPSDVAPVTPDKMVGITKNADESYSTVDGEQATPKKEVESEGETRDSDGVQSGGEGGGALAEGQDSAVVLMRQVETLTRTISTLSEERSKLEMNYQKDKKALLSQQEALTRQLQTEREKWDVETAKLHKQIEETQLHLNHEKRCREEDQAHHAAMLRELQELVVGEREGKTHLGAKLVEAEAALSRLHVQVTQDRSQGYEQKVQVLSGELEDLKERLKVAEEQNSRANPALLQLQKELERTRVDHLEALVAEQQRANEAEASLRLHAEHEERRVASLETRVAELSDMVGKYEQRREQDQLSIHKLKDRVTQLDSENTVLTKAQVEKQGFVNNDIAEQISALQEKVSKLKALLKMATQKISEKAVLPFNVEDMSVNDYARMISLEVGPEQRQQELFQLKDEYERYKHRAQAVLKSREVGKDVDLGRDLKDLQIQNSQQASQLETLRAQLAEKEEGHSLQLQSLREEVRSLHDKHQKDALQMELQYKQKLQDLNQHIVSARERTLRVIAEKDTELTQLRGQVQQMVAEGRSQGAEGRSLGGGARPPSVSRQLSVGSQSSLNSGGPYDQRPSHLDDSLHLSTTLTGDVVEGAVQELLEQSPAPSDGRLLLYKHDQQRKEAELSMSRRRWLELEEALREAQERHGKFSEQNKVLKEEIRKLERDRSRETENFEYLKNVVFHYMCVDGDSKEQMITPIATILHFSPDEVQQIKNGTGGKKWTYKF